MPDAVTEFETLVYATFSRTSDGEWTLCAHRHDGAASIILCTENLDHAFETLRAFAGTP